MSTRGSYCSLMVIDDLENIIEHLNESHSLPNYIDHVYKRVVDTLVNCANMFI